MPRSRTGLIGPLATGREVAAVPEAYDNPPMRCHRLYCPTLGTGIVALPAEEAHHAAHSLRVAIGQPVVLFDGLGREGAGVIEHVGRRELRVEVDAVVERSFEFAIRLTLAVAVPKTPRQGFLVEKCTELGVAELWPLITDRGVVKGGDAGVRKWSRRAVEAAKQSGRAWLPSIGESRSLRECLALRRHFDAAYLADTDGAHRPIVQALEGGTDHGTLLICVGPEGGWSDSERQDAAEHGVEPVTLGPTTLRTETAAIAACAAVALFFHA